MTEHDAVARTVGLPATVETIARDLHSLGVKQGDVILVHTSLSSLGWVCGGAVAVVAALRAAVGVTGTIAMPTHSTQLTEPSVWENPAVPDDWWQLIRDTMPAFDPAITPTRSMGAVPDCFRTHPDVTRSEHPYYSFAACGPRASELVADHALISGLGEGSPLARLYDLGASVLLIGVGHNRNTSLHLSEHRAFGERIPTGSAGAPILVEGQRQWVQYLAPLFDISDFGELGRAFADATGLIRAGNIAHAPTMLMPQRELVDFGARWLRANRPQPAAEDL